jgi:sulfatase maturation enzyme AslB (radical SAM superfamily)
MANESLSLIITAQCNLRCSYCYQNAKASRRAGWNVVQAGIDLVLREGSPQTELMFLGGEPLLELDLLRQAVSYAEALDPERKRFRFTISTNGTLISEAVADYLDEHEFDVQISFDGVQQAQAYRGSGTFEILNRVLDSLRAKHAQLFKNRLRIALTVIPDNFTFLPDSVRYLLEKDVREIRVSPCLTPYPGWQNDRIDELDEVLARVAEISLNHLRQSAAVPVTLLRKAGDEIPQRSSRRPACNALTGNGLALDVDGQAYTCTLLVESYQRFASGSLMEQASALKLGDVRDPEVRSRRAALAASAGAASLWKSLESGGSSYGNCNECEYSGRCTVCPVSIWEASSPGGPYRVPDFICAFNKVALKHRDRFPSVPDALKRFFPELDASGPIRRLEAYLRARQNS